MKANSSGKGVDPVFLILFAILILMGMVIFQTASSVSSYLQFGNPYHYFIQQCLEGILPGIVLFILISYIPYHFYKKLSLLIYSLALAINLLIFVPGLAVERYGASRWINLGITFQPSELLKLGLLLYVAMLLTKFKQQINSFPKLVFILLILSLSLGLVVGGQSNLSTGVLLVISSGMMIFSSPLKIRYITILSLFLVFIAILAILVAPYRLTRIQTFIQGSNEDKLGQGYQIEQSLIAVGSGGLFGVGWNQSRQKFKYLPEASSDSIFAIFAEEAGFVGVCLLVALFAAISFRIIWLSSRVSDDFARYILLGGAAWFMAQVFINIGSTIRLIPVTGIPLPFISTGSTSIWVLSALFGIIANISKFRKLV